MTEADLRERIIIALDVDSENDARSIVAELAGGVGAFKIGLQLFTRCGPDFVRELTREGHRVFLDLKFHDIPNTVAKACVEATRLNVWMLNVHGAGGAEMMLAARSAVDAVSMDEGIVRPLVIAVTVLTSSSELQRADPQGGWCRMRPCGPCDAPCSVSS
jgi:orotidine-5'-phosphate decarboxylase